MELTNFRTARPTSPAIRLAVVWLSLATTDTGRAQIARGMTVPFEDRDASGAYAGPKIIAHAPKLAYALGREVFQHEWTTDDGVQRVPSGDALFGATTSCVLCHNLPFGTAGYGGNAPLGSGWGRNIPSLAGVGLIESIGFQIRADILRAHDANHNGFLDVPAETAGQRALVEAEPGVVVDFGALDDRDDDGVPDLNPILIPRYLDGQGAPLYPTASAPPPGLHDPMVRGYDIIPGVFSASVGDHQFATVRQFSAGVFKSVFGIALPPNAGSPDPNDAPAAGYSHAWTAPSCNGAPQERLPIIATAHPGGEDPRPLTRSGLDLLEFFLLNQPRPAVDRQTPETRRGQQLLRTLGCVSCHVENWVLRSADAFGARGDRRTFDVDFRADEATGRWSAETRRIHARTGAAPAPNETTWVRGIYSDFKHHDLGPRFYEYVTKEARILSIRRFRTSPLWGVGSTAPYGHDGRSPTLDDVIRRHEGEAAAVTARYAASPADDRQAIVRFLQTLVLVTPAEAGGEPEGTDPAGPTGGDERSLLRECGVVPK